MSERSVARFLNGSEPPPSTFATSPSIRIPDNLPLPTSTNPHTNDLLDSSFNNTDAYLGFDFMEFDWTSLGLSNLDVTTSNTIPTVNTQGNGINDFLTTPMDLNLGYGVPSQDGFMNIGK